ncbi:hypothetical protein B4V02_06340 [Paenibacillus kribbensis]|uniref:Polyketide synthase n=1 Tax=Paenibacillus kribbensis TaxID=172713 RepID=A0A222WJY6_9BACL|nr:beta-ketoacyl synthase N-terminal-like domain-containing protein [Paenibacillus kribbensis]ASR46322.1 hypothetical protein B4V02_06340 [Paenibacillus kribbensis]
MKNGEQFDIYREQIKAVDRLLIQILQAQLQAVGLLNANPEDDRLWVRYGLKELYRLWMKESLDIFTRNPAVVSTVSDIQEVWEKWEQSKQHWTKDANLRAQVLLVEATLKALPEILTGKVPATDIMFPKGSMHLVEGIYKHNKVADYFNEVLSDQVTAFLQHRLKQHRGTKIRILEIGAGTGGTTSIVLDKLKPFQQYIEEYCYTDISKAFLKHGERVYGEQNPFLKFEVLNIEEAVTEQGIEVGKYDIVIAANVLHATRNIRRTLRNAKSLISNNGLILLNEISDKSIFTHLTFGLLEGWWMYEDPAVRIQGCPGLYPTQWKKLLEIEGYHHVGFLAAEETQLGQQIISAQSDGIVQVTRGTKRDRGRTSVSSQPSSGASIQTNLKSNGMDIEVYVKECIVHTLSESLKVMAHLIDHDDSFSDFGVDSITGTQLVQSINRILHIELENTDLFDYNSVNLLAAYILSQYKDVLSPVLPSRLLSPSEQNVQYFVKQTLLQHLSITLKVEVNMIDSEESFSDYGIDSITGVQFIQAINHTLGIELETTDLFDYSSIRQLSSYILSQHQGVVARTWTTRFQSDGLSPKEISANEKTTKASDNAGLPARNDSILNKKISEGIPIQDKKDDIAIIGMSGRFAQSASVEELWDHLVHGNDLIQEVSRWNLSDYYDQGKGYCNYGSFIEDIDRFDPRFFNITGLEAAYMDPQQRIFLEESWKALEDAGYAGSGVQGKDCGVYVGCGPSDYTEWIDDNPPAQAFWGNASSILPARISYYLDLHGPAIAVDTACSSSLVAIHMACQGLWTREIDMALAGGIFVQTTPNFYVHSNRANMLSPTGRCHAFDDKADGFVPGEGAGVVVLKRLEEAIADGDHIYGVIKGTAVNQDGFTNGITAPSAKSQERLEQTVFDRFGIHPENIQMVEAHGTGTQLGDPIEYKALNRAFSKYTNKKSYCALGTIKSNLGHTQYASGIAGVLKILLSLQHRQMVPSLHYQHGNMNIKMDNSPFYVNTSFKEWSVPWNTKRCAAISSFGFSGTNAHMVIEEAPEMNRYYAPVSSYLIVLSARTEEQLQQQAQQLSTYCKKEEELDLGNMSYTLLLGRKHLDHRLACIVSHTNELANILDNWLETGRTANMYVSTLNGSEIRDDPELKQHGNECIMKCIKENDKTLFARNLSAVAELYMQGYGLNYHQLFVNGGYSRVSLPTYPFGKEKFWVPQKQTISDTATIAPDSRKANMDDHHRSETRKLSYTTKQWAASPLVGKNDAVGTVAILSTHDTGELAACLASYFSDVRILGRDEIKDDLLMQDHMWNKYTGCIDLIGCGYAQEPEVEYISWLQKLIEYGNRNNLMLLCVTKDLESYRNEKINLSGALNVGLYRMLQSEYSYIRSRHMDGQSGMADRLFAEQIACEYMDNNEDTEVSYRDGQRYCAFLNEVNVQHNPVHERKFPENHVLWVTGGTKGLGLLCARHFVQHYGVKKLMLSGREQLPPKEQWNSLEAVDSATAAKIRAIQSIERLGVEVFVLSVELSDAEAMRITVETVKRFMGPIGGVIHCAGLADLENLAFIRKSPQVIGQVLNPKVLGLNVMYQSFMNEPLRFFVLFSSVSAIIPALGAGISDYAMANAYMDYFAESVAGTCPIMSIQWPSWREVGMGEVTSKPYKQAGLLSMSNEEGLNMLDSLLADSRYRVILPAWVNPVIWDPTQLMNRRLSATEFVKEERGPVQAPMQMLGSGYLDKIDLTEKTQSWLVSLFAKELRIDKAEFKPDTPFQEYGMDSILLAQVITRMDYELKEVSLDPSIILEYPTMKSLTAYLTENHPDILESFFNIEKSQAQEATNTECEQNPVFSLLKENTALKENKSFLDRKENDLDKNDKIAIIGIDCQFPDAHNKYEFWLNLKNGMDSIREAPISRVGHIRQTVAGKAIEGVGGFMDHIEDFDPDYFNIPPSLAIQIDPLQRKILECGAGAIADAGYTKEALWNKQVGVFVGARTNKYYQKLRGNDKDTIIGVGQNFIAAHLAHVYNLKGPNMIVDTACSSSLTAIHVAAKSVLNGESEIALAGGVDIILDGTIYQLLGAANIISPEGRSKAFSADANGIGVGEGCGVVVLKRLQQAIKDNNKIYGVIDGSALNNDGNTMGITTPNPEAQKELIEKAIADAHIHPETISYVEAHGTGTLIGDPIELKALTTVFSKFTGNKQFCGIGSVKSNIGHLISAAGIASFIKVLLSMSSGELPATLHCSNPNPRFNFDDSPFYIVKRHSKWTGIAGILRAGISSFGLGGNNAHIIVSNEGVPHALQAVLSSDDEGIRFNRRRYWPEPMDILESIKPVTRKAEEWKQEFFEPIEIYREGKL